MRKHWT